VGHRPRTASGPWPTCDAPGVSASIPGGGDASSPYYPGSARSMHAMPRTGASQPLPTAQHCATLSPAHKQPLVCQNDLRTGGLGLLQLLTWRECIRDNPLHRRERGNLNSERQPKFAMISQDDRFPG